jgi:hypothetical protein
MQFQSELAQKAGGVLTRSNVEELLGVTPEAVDQKRQSGQIMGISYGSEIRFPVAQLVAGGTAPGLSPS